jgi:hypothetical protein
MCVMSFHSIQEDSKILPLRFTFMNDKTNKGPIRRPRAARKSESHPQREIKKVCGWSHVLFHACHTLAPLLGERYRFGTWQNVIVCIFSVDTKLWMSSYMLAFIVRLFGVEMSITIVAYSTITPSTHPPPPSLPPQKNTLFDLVCCMSQAGT